MRQRYQARRLAHTGEPLSRTRSVVEEDDDRILLAAESSIVLCREAKPSYYEVRSLSTESRKIEPLVSDLVDAICLASRDKIVAVGAFVHGI